MATSTDSPLTLDSLGFSIDDVLLAPLAETTGLGGTGPYVINLQASSAPIDLPSQDVTGCQQAYVYRIQRVEDGRMRYRLRFGPFDREDEADAALIRVRNDYPGALTATACAEDLSSIAKMRAKGVISQPSVQATSDTAAQAACAAEALPALEATQSLPDRSRPPHRSLPQSTSEQTQPEQTQPEQALPEQALPEPTLPARSASEKLLSELAQLELVQDFQEITEQSAASPPRPDPTSIDAGFDISSISLSFELPQPKVTDSAAEFALALLGEAPQARLEAAAKPIRAAPASLDSTQTVRTLTQREIQDEASRWFVIELSVAGHPFDPATVPNLDIFVLYTLYSVEGMDHGRATHALRLGFFGEEMAAQAVANYLTTYYEAPAVKRVSIAERERFAERRIDARKDVGATGQHSAIEITSELQVLKPRIVRAPAVPAAPRQTAERPTQKDKPAGLFASLPWVKRRS